MAQEVVKEQKDLSPGWWMIPKTSTQVKFGGYVKFDLIHDFNPISSPDFFDVSKIPTDGSKGESTNLNAKETRFFIDTRTPSKVGEIRAYAEVDFYGTGGALRLRHAFIEVGKHWMFGQYWSTFMDENIIPNTLDFEKPAAYAFARHVQVRYKAVLSDHAYLAFALEQPNTNAQTPDTPGKFESPLPDLTARFRVTESWGHIQLSGFAAKLVYRYTAGGMDEVSLFGGNLSGNFIFNSEKDKLIYQVVFGPGVGRFRGGLSAGLDAGGNLEALNDLGYTLGLEHRWSPAFASLFVFNQGTVDNTAGQPLTSIHQANYFATNFTWNFAERAIAGVEYLRGTRKDENELSGTANRIQFSVKYVFNN